jgi:hypothetical protein
MAKSKTRFLSVGAGGRLLHIALAYVKEIDVRFAARRLKGKNMVVENLWVNSAFNGQATFANLNVYVRFPRCYSVTPSHHSLIRLMPFEKDSLHLRILRKV